MRARAVDTEYYFGGCVETRLLHVDYMMQFSYRGRRSVGPAGVTRAALSCGPSGAKGGEKSGWK